MFFESNSVELKAKRSGHTVDVEMNPSAVFDGFGRTIQEEHFALVPSLVVLVDGGQVERRLAGQSDPTLVSLANVRRIAVVPNVNGNFDAILLPLNNIRHSYSVGKVEGTAKDHILA